MAIADYPHPITWHNPHEVHDLAGESSLRDSRRA